MPRGARKGESRTKGVKIENTMAVDRALDALGAEHARKKLRQLSVQSRAKKMAEVAEGMDYCIEPREGEYPHVWMGAAYAQDVVEGNIPACRQVRDACARFRAMLQDDRFVFSRRLAERVCLFAEQMPHAKGTWKTKTITLEPWQCFVLIAIFGFYWAHDPTLRVVKSAYVEVPRKNAKSTLAAVIGNYMLTEDGEPGAEVYSAATTHKQALAVFDTARQMALRQRGFQDQHHLAIGSQVIKLWGTLSKFQPLHAEGSTLDGLNIYCVLVDELHAHKTRVVWDVLETAMGSRRNPLLFSITTAGVNRAGICYEVRDYVNRLLTGRHDDPTWFGIVYTIDPDDRWDDPKSWAKANPNLNVSVHEAELARLAKKAGTMLAALNNFLTKHLDVWVNAATNWLDMRKWDAAADPTLTLASFQGEEAKAGIDLASRVDIASRALMFRREIEGTFHYYLLCRHYLPDETIVKAMDDDEARNMNSQYAGWVHEGRIITTPGAVTDQDVIQDDLIKDAAVARITELAFDPYQASHMMTSMVKEGFTVVEVRPTVLNFSQPMKEFEALLLEGRLHHDGDPVLSWMLSNVVCFLDAKDNIYPRKEFPENKIDGVVAALMALNRWLAGTEDGPSVYTQRGLITL